MRSALMQLALDHESAINVRLSCCCRRLCSVYYDGPMNNSSDTVSVGWYTRDSQAVGDNGMQPWMAQVRL